MNYRHYITFKTIASDLTPIVETANFLAIITSRTGGQTNDTEDAAIKVWHQYIYPRYWGNVIDYCDNDSEDDLTSIELTNHWHSTETTLWKIYSWWISSKEYYIPLIELYEDEAEHLMDQVRTISINKFNDTPQQAGTWTGDDYVSSISKNESVTDANTVIGRIKEIRDKIENLYETWSNEFRKWVIYE